MSILNDPAMESGRLAIEARSTAPHITPPQPALPTTTLGCLNDEAMQVEFMRPKFN